MRVDPHLLGLSILDLLERDVIVEHRHTSTGWLAYKRARPEPIEAKLADLVPLYHQISQGEFPNRVGDALEIAVLSGLRALAAKDSRFAYLGDFHLDAPKNAQGRYIKVEPPRTVSGGTTNKQADFMLIGFPEGIISIECKNYREWLYPRHTHIAHLIRKSYETNTIPLIVQRRIHYSTLSNFLEPAGIIAHETLYQYYPDDELALAARVKSVRGLGFSDVLASRVPHQRTLEFFTDRLARVVPPMAAKWARNREALYRYAIGEANLAETYTAIGSPAGGKWKAYGEQADFEGHEN